MFKLHLFLSRLTRSYTVSFINYYEISSKTNEIIIVNCVVLLIESFTLKNTSHADAIQVYISI